MKNDMADYSALLEDNLKKALTELLILHLLSENEYYIGDLANTLHERSGEVLSIVFPYSAVYRLVQGGYIFESGKRIAPDGRRRQYYSITELGRNYEEQLIATYKRFLCGVENILNGGEVNNGK